MSEEKKIDTEVFYGKGKKIVISKKEFYVKEFVLKKRIEFFDKIFDALKTAVDSTPENMRSDQNTIGRAIIKELGSKVTDIYKMVLDCDDEEWLLNNVKPRDEIEIFKTIAEVNDIPFLLSQIRELTGRAKKEALKS